MNVQVEPKVTLGDTVTLLELSAYAIEVMALNPMLKSRQGGVCFSVVWYSYQHGDSGVYYTTAKNSVDAIGNVFKDIPVGYSTIAYPIRLPEKTRLNLSHN
jgi:hypothetical protein